MEISVEGWRSGTADWSDVQRLPKEQLPALTTEQKEVARNLGISEEDYARSAEAGQRTQRELLDKTAKFARLLEQRVKERASQAAIEKVTLKTWEHRLDVRILLDGGRFDIRIDEDLVDDLMESGSLDAGERLSRILGAALPTGVH
jgi:hypothetical protein